MSGCTRGRLFALALVLSVLAAPAARAADAETRDFAVFVSGKPVGEVHLTIKRQDDGVTTVNCDTDIHVNLLIGKYKFVFRGREEWKGRRLVKFASNTDDNGKQYVVSGRAEEGGVRVKANNEEKVVKSEVWLTTYWSLPDPKLRDKELTVLDADNGKVMAATLKYVATEKVKIAGKEATLNRYRLSGGVKMDLWYDGSDRLVRQEWVEQGHKTVVELTRVRK
jgi:Domain of unknown function (DUF6134)